MLAGVSGGVAAALGVDVVVVRIAFLVGVAIGGVGVVLYAIAAAAMPLAAGPRPARRLWPTALGAALVVGALMALLDGAGLQLPDGILLPVALAGAGAGLIWRRAGGEVRLDPDSGGIPGGARALGGVLLVAAGLALAIGQSGGSARWSPRPSRRAPWPRASGCSSRRG